MFGFDPDILCLCLLLDSLPPTRPYIIISNAVIQCVIPKCGATRCSEAVSSPWSGGVNDNNNKNNKKKRGAFHLNSIHRAAGESGGMEKKTYSVKTLCWQARINSNCVSVHQLDVLKWKVCYRSVCISAVLKHKQWVAEQKRHCASRRREGGGGGGGGRRGEVTAQRGWLTLCSLLPFHRLSFQLRMYIFLEKEKKERILTLTSIWNWFRTV